MPTITLHRFPSQSKPHAKTTTKVCKGCPETGPQPLENFYVNNHAVDRHCGTCKVCEAKKRAVKEQERKMYNGF